MPRHKGRAIRKTRKPESRSCLQYLARPSALPRGVSRGASAPLGLSAFARSMGSLRTLGGGDKGGGAVTAFAVFEDIHGGSVARGDSGLGEEAAAQDQDGQGQDGEALARAD